MFWGLWFGGVVGFLGGVGVFFCVVCFVCVGVVLLSGLLCFFLFGVYGVLVVFGFGRCVGCFLVFLGWCWGFCLWVLWCGFVLVFCLLFLVLRF